MASIFDKVMKRLAKSYQSAVYKHLREYGLRYEDIVITENPDLQKALKYLPKEEYIARQRRIKRAVDLSFKHEALPKEIQEIQEPGKIYLVPLMEQFRLLREERELLNSN